MSTGKDGDHGVFRVSGASRRHGTSADFERARTSRKGEFGIFLAHGPQRVLYNATLSYDGDEILIEFVVTAGASRAAMDACFLGGLAQHVSLDYLKVGEDKASSMETYSGYVHLDGRIQVDFQVPAGASSEQRDAAFVAALAQQVSIEYTRAETAPMPLKSRSASPGM